MDNQIGQKTSFQTSNNKSKKKLAIGTIIFIIIAISIFLVISFNKSKEIENNISHDPTDNIISDDKIIGIDSDSDELLDDEEDLLGTDKFKSDTDDDGYSDLVEIENGYNPLGEGESSEEFNKIAEKIILNRNKRLLDGFMEKYNSLEEYSIEYEVYTASEERSYFGPEGDSSYNTKSGSSFLQKTYKKGDNFRTDNDGSTSDAYKVFFTFDGNLVNNLEEIYIDNQYISCGGGICKKNDQFVFFDWDWKYFQNPNFFYNYLASSDYTVKHLDSGTNIAFNEEIARAYYNKDEVKRKYYSVEELEELGNKCERFRIILDEKIYIENINYLDENISRKAEIDIYIDNNTGAIVYLSVLAQSDAKGEDENKLYNIISWNAHIGTIIANDEDILQKGRYTFIGKAWDKNELVIVIEPYISNYASGSVKFFNSDGTVLKEMKLNEESFVGQEKKKLVIEHNLNLEKEIKYELCVDDFCKIIEPSIISKNYDCFKNSLDKTSCEKIDGCFYDNDLCLEFECTSLLVKDKRLCEENGCYWTDDRGDYNRCFDYFCKFHQDESSCNETEDCLWLNSYCKDKECYLYEKKETCETSNLKCIWNSFRCDDFSCLRMDNENECVVNNECSWKEKEGEGEGTCKDINEIEGNLPTCLSFEEDDCIEEERCSWKESQCFYNICGIYTSKLGCNFDKKCFWEPYSSCVDK